MSNERGPSIVVENLSKKYGDFVALDGVSFSIEPGQIVGFLGPNGAGKTTTMKILTCFMAASGGKATVAGHDVYEESETVRKKIGYLPENVPLYDEMLVYDYLMFIAEIRGVEASKRKDAVKKAVELTGLREVVNRDIIELSKGYRQRVGLAQAIIHEPDVIILDEPTSGLDPNQILDIRDLITEIGREKTVIFSTHILQEVSAVCDRIIVVNKGKIVADGTFEELAAEVAKGREGLVVSFGQATMSDAELEAIAALKGVAEVIELKSATGDVTLRIVAADEKAARGEVMAFAAAKDLEITAIARFRPDLEATFRALTGGSTDEGETGRRKKSSSSKSFKADASAPEPADSESKAEAGE